VDTLPRALAAAESLGFPVVLKTDEPRIGHKADVGGVLLDVVGPDQVAAGYQALARRLGPRVLVAATAAPGVELALGLVRDPHLGPLLVVGAGGALVEMLNDRVVRLPPLDEVGALRALGRLRADALLNGVAGTPAADRSAVARAVVSLSQLALELGDALEALDINPLRCSQAGCTALDVLVEPRRTPPVD
jgi:hypothetical protein